MAVLDVSEEKFSVAVDTPISTASVSILGEDEATEEFTAQECFTFAKALLRAAFLLDATVLSYDATQVAMSDE